MVFVEIVKVGNIPKNSILIEGFQGVGLVAVLASEYIAKQKKAKIVGYINSDVFPPMALMIDGELRHPAPIYHIKGKDNDFLVISSELPIPHIAVYDFAKKIVEFAKKNQVKEIVSLEGIATREPPVQSNVYYVTSNKTLSRRLMKFAMPLKNGIIVGISATVLLQAALSKVPAYALMAEAHSQFPDGLAAVELIKKLNVMYGLDIDVSELVKESKRFEKKIWEIVQKAKRLKSVEGEPRKSYIG